MKKSTWDCEGLLQGFVLCITWQNNVTDVHPLEASFLAGDCWFASFGIFLAGISSVVPEFVPFPLKIYFHLY